MSEQGGGPSARRRLADERARAAARGRRQRALLVVLGAVALAGVVVAAVVVLVSRNGGEGPAIGDYKGALAPATRQQDGSVAMAKAGVTAPVLDVWEDFQCPACKAMEARLGGTMKQLAADGELKVVYRPFQLFQQEPLMSNSRRAANAAACMPADHWVKYHDRLYAEQPEEGKKGFLPQDLIAWAADLGVTDPSFAACVNGEQKMKTVNQASALAGRSGVDATPYLALNGRKVGDDVLGSPDELKKAVAKAAGSAPAPGGTRSTGTATGNAAPAPGMPRATVALR
ncbi:DsbA family protein [Actinomadura bangladeshensis]|uniref:Thioredoxin domain-containing protein n=1 Tax=Actinomadura bangladeshensis TaxID=453573 RepID=A0A6L9QE19_9ACTN|nr:thioredoxin domain-containing protein [Actinomadura bangladeshensis]NEA23691.1 thioredoxin domain-containing protein [Actinomadura bangladeshensis]